MSGSVKNLMPEEVLAASPPHPPCFHDRTEWVGYLYDCHRYGEKNVSRPFGKTGVFRPAFNFCGDCTPEHARGKKLQGKCKPETFRTFPIKVVACN